MDIDERIAEMLAFAVVNPYTGQEDIKLYQRLLADDLTLTLYIRGNGRVSLTSLRKITGAEVSNVIKTLAPLRCLYDGPHRSGKYYIARFHFSDPAKEPPVFASPLDKYLTAVKPIPESKSVNRWAPATLKPKPPVSTPHTWQEVQPYSAPMQRHTPPPIVEEPQEPYWHSLPDDRCHICHRELTDPISIGVSIGSICRKRIEEAEENVNIWENISREELERIWTAYNIYEQRRTEKLK